MPKLVSLPIIGLPLAEGWSQVCENGQRSLVFAIAIAGENSANIGRDISQKIKQLDIKNAQELYQFCTDLLTHTQQLGVRLQLAGLYLLDNKYTLVGTHGTILLKRASKIGKLLSTQENLQIIQGKMQADDVLILATNKAHLFLKEIQLKLEQGFEADKITNSLIEAMHSLENSSLCAISISRVAQENITEEPIKKDSLILNFELDFDQQQTAVEEVNEPAVTKTVEAEAKPIILADVSAKSDPVPLAIATARAKPIALVGFIGKVKQQFLKLLKPPNPMIKLDLSVKPETSVEPNQQVIDEPPKLDRSDIDLKSPAVAFDQPPNPDHATSLDQAPSTKQPLATEQTPSLDQVPSANQPLATKQAPNLEALLAPAQEYQPKKDIKLKLPNLNLADKIKDFQQTGQVKLQSQFSALSKTIANLATTTVSGLKKLKNKIGQKQHYVETLPKRQKWQFFFIVFSLISILALAVFTTVQLKNQQIRQAKQATEQARLILEQAEAEVVSSPFKARELAQQSIEQLQQANSHFANKRHANQYINEQLILAKQFYESISGKEELQQLPVFLDLQKLDSNFLASLIAVNDQHLALIDKQQKKLLIHNFGQQTNTQFSLEQLEQFTDLVLSDKGLYLLGKGLHLLAFNFDQENPTLSFTQLKEQGDSDRGGRFLQKFSSYLYIFNPDKRNIYRYTIRGNGLSEPIGWLISKQGLEFANITSMAVDGDLWLSTNTGQLKKFTKGSQDNDFALKGAPNQISQEFTVYTNENLNNLYLLIRDEQKLLIFNKQGEFQKEIVSPSLASVTGLAVNEQLQKAFAISGSLVFEIVL